MRFDERIKKESVQMKITAPKIADSVMIIANPKCDNSIIAL